MQLWCVGLWLMGGRHRICVFDGFDEARDFMFTTLIAGTFDSMVVDDVSIWEM